jgi:murein DD-endopeptidase MepM/ murein hydrolase activator NlpD
MDRRASPSDGTGSSDPATNHGVSSHDDHASVKPRHHDVPVVAYATGWSAAPARRGPAKRRIVTFLLMLPLVLGMVGAPATAPTAHGDELGDAKAKQAQIKKEIARQKEQVKALNALQAGLSSDIAKTRRELSGINADLSSVKKKISKMQSRIEVVQANYVDLLEQLTRLDYQLIYVTDQETKKRVELRDRKALLADRIRAAYDTDRTSMLESFLSGRTFADLLTEMSYFIDVGEQDKALAEQIVRDQESLAVMHETTIATRARTDELRLETAAQKKALDASLKQLKAAKAELRKLEKATKKSLAAQRALYARIMANKKDAAKALAAAAAAQKKLAAKIADIVAKQAQQGNIPSEYNGTLKWPMAGNVTQNFGCTGFSWEPPLGDCDHFHRGIDIVAPYGTKVRASGEGVVAYIGWNYADGADPAWIVIIAHSSGLQTWYAHMQPKYPGGIKQGSHVTSGQVIGYEGNTGHSTGAHLHWAVMFNGSFANPRLFL